METLFTNGHLRIERLIVGPLENNVYVVSNRDDAVIIDAADEAHRILSAVDGLKVSSILTTHGHFDHVGAVREVAASLGAPFRLHEADAELAGLEPDLALADEEIIFIGDQPLVAMHTPGHTPGSMSFLIGEQLFTGDTLFP
ncbi:MAG: MBL fold metallo-hydrolase, partial [Acidimicrobiia bacterium]|nr:MBL fold metallo-hydrolase [Acidimicrobiia bacterium]